MFALPNPIGGGGGGGRMTVPNSGRESSPVIPPNGGGGGGGGSIVPIFVKEFPVVAGRMHKLTELLSIFRLLMMYVVLFYLFYSYG